MCGLLILKKMMSSDMLHLVGHNACYRLCGFRKLSQLQHKLLSRTESCTSRTCSAVVFYWWYRLVTRAMIEVADQFVSEAPLFGSLRHGILDPKTDLEKNIILLPDEKFHALR